MVRMKTIYLSFLSLLLFEKWKRSREKVKKEQRAKNWKEQGARGEIVKGAGSMDPPNRGSLTGIVHFGGAQRSFVLIRWCTRRFLPSSCLFVYFHSRGWTVGPMDMKYCVQIWPWYSSNELKGQGHRSKVRVKVTKVKYVKFLFFSQYTIRKWDKR